VKLIVDEPASVALHRELGAWSAWTSSALLGVEAVRACRRLGEGVADSAEASLSDIALVPVDDAGWRSRDVSTPASSDRWMPSIWLPR